MAKDHAEGGVEAEQVAALCYREHLGRVRVLLVTSRGRNSWILPKGWPIKGLSGPGSALQEAWEEAGVAEGRVGPSPLGRVGHVKRGQVRWADVYPVRVERLAETWPEAGQRARLWLGPEAAARRVRRAELKALLLGFVPPKGL